MTKQDRGDLLALALGLAALLVAVKLCLLPFPVASLGDLLHWLLRLALVVSADLCFVAALTVVCALSLLICRRWPRIHRGGRTGVFLLFYAAGLYGVLAYSMYRITLVPFTVRLLSFAAGPSLMADSIGKYITWPLITALVAGPILVLLLPRWLRFLPNIEFTRVRRLMATATAILLIAIYGFASQSYMHAHWTDPGRWERRIAQSPHAVLLASCVDELLQAEPFTASFLTHNMDDRDFRRRGSVQTMLPESARANRPRNVVVFFLESSGAEYLSLHGARHDTTPNLKRLAAEKGVMFEDLYVSVPNSCKSLVALTSSVYPRPDWKLIVQDCPQFSVPSIQQVLVNEGYRTCFAHSGFWSWRNRDNYLRQRGAQTLIDADTLQAKRINSWGVSDQAMFDACLDWIDADRQTPFFLLAYTIETHHPYARPEHPIEFDVADPELNDYLNALRATDERIARFMRQLAERGLEESTLVVVTTDHGESFGQHNQREHMFGVYQPNVHIPLVMLHPSLQDLPRRIKGTREQIDIAPTILDLLGFASPSDWQGRNLFRQDEDRPGYFFCVGNHVVLGLRDKQWKYHYYVDTGEQELFDLANDPDENRNLAGAHVSRCLDYRRRVGGLVHYQRALLSKHGAP